MDQLQRLALRVARSFEPCYSPSRPLSALPPWPYTTWHRCERLRRLMQTAESRGWKLAAAHLREQLTNELERLAALIREVLDKVTVPWNVLQEPSPRSLYEEVLALQREFPALRCDLDRPHELLAVETERIVLQGIDLGPFEIRFACDPAVGLLEYTVVALEPHPPATNEGITHPHVQGDVLCAGDAKYALRTALRDGRLSDFCLIVGQVLATYNSHSAYVLLSEWTGKSCSGCGQITSEDLLVECHHCSDDLCGDCAGECAECKESHCRSCLEACSVCYRRCCANCLPKCEDCGKQICTDCAFNQKCEACDATTNEWREGSGGGGPAATSADDDDSEPELEDLALTPVCTDRLEQAAVPA